jgi:beta-galactosidase
MHRRTFLESIGAVTATSLLAGPLRAAGITPKISSSAVGKSVRGSDTGPVLSAHSLATRSLRQVISLDGEWQVGEGTMLSIPKQFAHKVVVPGLMDMATPGFIDPGPRVSNKDRKNLRQKDPRRDAFWYRRTFQIETPIPQFAMLKIGKAMFGTRVILNGSVVGDHWPCFTPGLFDVRSSLKRGENELIVRVGADRDAVNGHAQSGYDDEKSRYIPGIYDSVELILTGSPHILNVQAVPNIENQSVTVYFWLCNAHAPTGMKLRCTIREASTGLVAGEGDYQISPPIPAAGSELTGQITIPIRNCRLWSPETPFLYKLEVQGNGDLFETRFGMRTFRFDPVLGRAILNGHPYFMRGTSICIFRFMEDVARGDLPWREDWIRRLFEAFRDVHFNSVRFSLGFPPESWYRIADEEGFLIQDEFPVWYGLAQPGNIDGAELAGEYKEWLQERWNHPCVILWTACNETRSTETGKAIRMVRDLDYSGRPWDNSWSVPVEPGDSDVVHPYHFVFGPDQPFAINKLASDPGTKATLFIAQPFAEEKLNWPNAIVINEYGALWLNRDGMPTLLTQRVYDYLLGPNSTTAERRYAYARNLAALTEFFRAHRQAAAVMYFCGLDYSRPDGWTSDNWTDVQKLTWEPEFYTYVRDAFSPVGLMIDAWADKYAPGPAHEFPVVVINDLNEPWKGSVRCRLIHSGNTIEERTQLCEVAPWGSRNVKFGIPIPVQPGNYQLEAVLFSPGSRAVRSLRDFKVPLNGVQKTQAP